MRLVPSTFAAGLLLTVATALAAAGARWDAVPAKDRDRVNPLAGNALAVPAGQILYRNYCRHCHGEDALGDGKKKPSLRSSEVEEATDGDLEWFLRQGDLRQGMPSWSSLPQAQRWQIIAYLRSLPPVPSP